ncbi:alpha/beta-hydrolase [Xylariaceae sp. FL0662B]|nr:alpha/beta-hydrolase [Xylariaceae sp. FL0662B]
MRAASSSSSSSSSENPGPLAAMKRSLQALRRRTRPWHVFALLAAVATIAAVLAGVLVANREHQRKIEEDRRTPSDQGKARTNLGYAQYQGSLVGTDRGVAQYLGLRYAAAPLGDRRFRAPLEPEDDFGDQPANTFGPICLGISVPYPAADQSEDCLYANVWAPANATRESKLPVWLYIQGGGYTSNSNANWNGTEVVERSGGNIILVNFNYRVGLWGFLASERVRDDGALNAGLLDQRAMMRWVQRHIVQFGGDPSHVVIHGGSAGAGSVALHLVAYGGTDKQERLFVGAVGESVFFPAQPSVADLEWQFDRLLGQTGCDGADRPMACLRSQGTGTLQAANVPSPFPGRFFLPLFYWTPCVDGDFLRDLPVLLFERGQFLDVPLIVGTTTDEGTIFTPNTKTAVDMANFLRDNYPRLSESQAEGIVEQYPLTGQELQPAHWPWYTSAAQAYGEATFICPAAHMLSSYVRHLNATNRAWGYRYDVYDAINAAAGRGVVHLFESWAIFGPDSIAGPGRGPPSYYTYNAPVVPLVMDYWISFVRTLDPSAMRSPDAPVWEPWSADKKRLLMQVDNFTTETVPQDQQSRCNLWKTLAPVTQQ